MTAGFVPEDTSLRDQIMSALSAHAANCQAVTCAWCDNLAVQADAVIMLLTEYPPDLLHAQLRAAGGRGAASEPGS